MTLKPHEVRPPVSNQWPGRVAFQESSKNGSRGGDAPTDAAGPLQAVRGEEVSPPPTPVTRRSHWVIMSVFALIVLPFSLYGFGAKFLEFIAVFRGEADGTFAVTPIVNYLLASLGFFCLLLWATAQGMFRDVERPKVEHLEREAELDRLQSISRAT